MTNEIQTILSLFNAQKIRNEKKAIEILRQGVLPTPSDIKNTINSSLGDYRALLMLNHKYNKEKTLRSGFDALVACANAAYVDICKLEAAIPPHFLNSKTHSSMEYVITDPVQKEVIAFCAAAHGIIEVTRKFKSTRPSLASQIDQITNEFKYAQNTVFILKLRTNLSHGSVIIPTWNVTADKNGVRGSLTLHIPLIISQGEWNTNNIEYFRSQGGEFIDIKIEIGKYLQALTTYSVAINKLFSESKSAEEVDFYEIEDSFNRKNRTHWLKVSLGQMKDPHEVFKHLGRYFTDEQVRAINKFRRGSREQIDFMLALKSAEYEVDDELKNQIYSQFSILESE